MLYLTLAGTILFLFAYLYFVELVQKHKGIRKRVASFLLPRLNERIAFLYSLSCILFISFNKTLHEKFYYLYFNSKTELLIVSAALLIPVVLIAFFLIMPIYHVLIKRRKTRPEKLSMIILVGLSQVFVSLIGAVYALTESTGILESVLPAWNLLTALLLVTFLNSNYILTDIVDDEDATLVQILLGVLVIIGLFYLTYFKFNMLWVFGLSICFIYSHFINEWLIRLARYLTTKVRIYLKS